MKTLLIQSKDDSAAKAIAQMARKRKMKVRFLSDTKMEDEWLVTMIDKAHVEKGEVSRAEMARKFKHDGIDF
jgi:hypothetical protein